jgi:hypothetical protein
VAGTYDISTRGGNNGNDTSKIIKLKIDKGKLNGAVNTTVSASTGAKLEDIELPDLEYSKNPSTLVWKDPNDTVGKEEGVSEKAVTLVPDDTANYYSQDLKIDINVKRNFATYDFERLVVGEQFELKLDGAKFEHISGDLPDGIKFDKSAEQAIVSGTPTTLGSYDFEIKRTELNDTSGKALISKVTAKVSYGTPKVTTELLTGWVGRKLSEVQIVNTSDDMAGTWQWAEPDTILEGEVGQIVTFEATFTPSDTNWLDVTTEVEIVLNQEKIVENEVFNNAMMWSIISGGIIGVVLIVVVIILIVTKKSASAGGPRPPRGGAPRNNNAMRDHRRR